MSFKYLSKSVSTMCVTSAYLSTDGTLFFDVTTVDGSLIGSGIYGLRCITQAVNGDIWNVCFATKELENLFNSELLESIEDSQRVIKTADLRDNLSKAQSAIAIHSCLSDFLVKNNTNTVLVTYGDTDFLLYVNDDSEDVYLLNGNETSQQSFLDALWELV